MNQNYNPTYIFLEEIRKYLSNYLYESLNNKQLSEILGFNSRYIDTKYYRIRKGALGNLKYDAFLSIKNRILNKLKNNISQKLSTIFKNYENYLMELKDYGMSLKRSKFYHPFLNVNYFEIIDTKEKAYWLGFLYADGCITNGINRNRNNKRYRRIKLTQNRRDKIIIYRFVRILGLNFRQIYYNLNTDSYEIQFRNHKIADDLINHGILFRKSKIIQLPPLSNNELYLAFLLGYYDGDGETGAARIHSGSKIFLFQIKKKFNIKNKIYSDFRENGVCYKLRLGSDLFREMLWNYKRSLKRKRTLTN